MSEKLSNLQNTLQKTGLSEKQANVYKTLIEVGKAKVKQLIPLLKLNRTTIYTILEELVQKNIIERDDSKPIATYRARHPYVLKELVEQKISEIKETNNELEALLPNLTNVYQKIQKKPGIQFFEGKEGVKKLLTDSLNTKTEILTIADVEAINKHIKEINKDYVIKRNRHKIKKRLLVIDSPYAREHFKNHNEMIDVKFCQLNISPFNTGIQIYDNKIAFITMADDFIGGSIVSDPYVYSLLKEMFEFIWQKT